MGRAHTARRGTFILKCPASPYAADPKRRRTTRQIIIIRKKINKEGEETEEGKRRRRGIQTIRKKER